MLTLGIDTATKVCTVGLVKDKEPIINYEVNIGMTHSEGLVPQLEQIFSRSEIEKKDVNLIGISIGPGSFTGLRIGLATAEAMAYSWKVPVIGVSTLKALAYNVEVEGIKLACILDAQKGNFYLAIYEWENGELLEISSVEVISTVGLLEKLAKQGHKTLILGEYQKLKAQDIPMNVCLAPKQLAMPKGSSVALLANSEYKADENSLENSFFGLEPYYIRRSEAEVMWEKKQKK